MTSTISARALISRYRLRNEETFIYNRPSQRAASNNIRIFLVSCFLPRGGVLTKRLITWNELGERRQRAAEIVSLSALCSALQRPRVERFIDEVLFYEIVAVER